MGAIAEAQALYVAQLAAAGIGGGGITPFKTPGQVEAEGRLDIPKPEPKPEPPKFDPFLLPLVLLTTLLNIPNVMLNKYLHKEEEEKDCEAELKKYGVGEHRDVSKKSVAGVTASHHVLQNAYLQNERFSNANFKGGSISGCPNYSENDGVAILVDDTKPLGDHEIITKMQDDYSRRLRLTGTVPTYPQVREQIGKELKTIQKPIRMTEKGKNCILLRVDKMMLEKCPGIMNGSKPLRTPYSREKV